MIRIQPVSYNNYKSNNAQTKENTTIKSIPAFKAKEYPSGIYSNWFVSQMQSYMVKTEKERKDSIEKDLEQYKAESRKAHITKNLFGKVDNDVADRLYDYTKLEHDLLNEQKQEKKYENSLKETKALQRVNYEKEKQSIKDRELIPDFCQKVQLEKEGFQISFPNSIMLVGKNKELNKELIDWTAINSNCNFVIQQKETDPEEFMDSLFNTLDEIKQKNKRTLLYVEGFEDLINPEINPEGIAGMKKIMCKLATEYNTTIIFDCDNPAKIDKNINVPHRITNKIKTDIVIPEIELQKPTFEHQECHEEIDEPNGKYSSLRDYNKRHYEPPSDSGSGGGSDDKSMYEDLIDFLNTYN